VKPGGHEFSETSSRGPTTFSLVLRMSLPNAVE
jgi:hypothetical protein